MHFFRSLKSVQFIKKKKFWRCFKTEFERYICVGLQEKAEQWVQSTKDTANVAREKTGETAQCVSDSAQQGKDQTAGIIHQVLITSPFCLP